MNKKAILWHYKYKNMRESWALQMQWLVKALQGEGYTVIKHRNFVCRGLEELPIYDFKKDNPSDLVVYNHCDVSHLLGNVIKTNKVWFFKPTVPDKYHTTLDELGYGAYSSITYEKPDFEKYNARKVKKFFDTKVKDWIEKRNTKWGNYFKNKEAEVRESNYYLVLGQCGGDYTVTRQDFGIYWAKLEAIIRELVRVGDKPIVVKLHPYTDGENAKDDKFSRKLAKNISAISEKVSVYLGMTNIHNFIEKADCVILANSGAGFEAMMHHKPIIAWGASEYRWTSYDLRHLCDLHRALKLDWFNRERQDKFLYFYLEKYCYFDQQSCNHRIRELLYGK